MKRIELIWIILILCTLNARSQVIRTSGGPLYHQEDTTRMYSSKYAWNLSRIVHGMKWIENTRPGSPDSAYVSEIDSVYRELKAYRDSRMNYALMDKQINLQNQRLDKAWKEMYQRTTPYGIVRKEILSGKPDATDSLILNGIGFREDNKPDKAYACFKKAVGNKPNRLDNYFFIIVDEMEFTRDTIKAMEYINNAINLSNGKKITSFNPYETRAWIYVSRKQYSLACDDMNKVLEKEPDNQHALFNRAHIKKEMTDYAGSNADFQQILKCIQSKPFIQAIDSALLLNDIGWNYYLMKDYKLCLDYAGQSLLLRPDYPYALDTKGSGYYGLGEYEKCIDYMTKAIASNPELGNSWYLRGMSYLKLNSQDRACANLTKAAALGVAEAAKAMKGLCHPPIGTEAEKQKQFPANKSSNKMERIRVDANGVYFRF